MASAHGDLLHSWAADVAHIVHPNYEWHPFAKLWQTPGEGEAAIAAQEGLTPNERAPLFEGMGVSHDDALEIVAGADAIMGACMLELYRSATPNPHRHWGPWEPSAAPGLVLHPTADPFGDERMAAEVARSFGAPFEPLDGVGHFWPYEAPEQGAAMLASFWSSLG